MKRVLLAYQPVDGGVARHVTDLAIGLSEQGYEVTLCGPEMLGHLQGLCRWVQLDLVRAISPTADATALATFIGIVRQVRPSLIHAHSSKAGAITRLDRLAQPRIPVLYTPHGYAFAGHFSREFERRLYRDIEHGLSLLASRIVCVCEAEARLARTVAPDGRIRVVYNGIDPSGEGPVDPQIAELADRGPLIGALTRLHPGKGLETLIDAMPRVLAEYPNTQVVIGGDGPELLALRSRATERGVSQAIHFLGDCSRPISILRGLDLFVHPSLAESFPYVILEAMSVGLPIVASDVGGIGEALVNGESGLLVPSADCSALSEMLLRLLGNPRLRASIGTVARQRVEQRFTRTQMIENLIDVYEEVTSLDPPVRV